MGKIVILEGPDGGGKTTLSNQIRRIFPGSYYVHLGPPEHKEELVVTYAKLLWRASLRPGLTVIDRLHLGESIYGPLLRKQDLLGEEGLNLIRRMIHGYGALEVLCLPPFRVALENWNKNKKSELIKDEYVYQRVYEAYRKVSLKHAAMWDYTVQGDVENVRENLERLMQCVPDPLPKGVIGSQTHEFLFVGEKANHKDLDAPFISLGGSSHYLYECLQDAGFKEREMAFLNAYDLAGNRLDVQDIWEQLARPKTIYLGGRAALFKVPNSIKIPHPAFWKRFHSGKRSEYVSQLKAIRDSHYVRSEERVL